MHEKIVAKLKTQRGTTSNVSDRTMEDMAKAFELVINTDEVLATFDFSSAIKSMDGNISNYTAEQVKLMNSKTEAERVATEKAEAEKAEAEKAEAERIKGGGVEVPEWAKAMKAQSDILMEQNKTLAEKLGTFEQNKTHESRRDILKKKLTGLPDYFVKPIQENFKNAQFSDEDAFTGYIGVIEQSAADFKQKAAEGGLNIDAPSPNVKKPENNGQTEALADAFATLEKSKK